MFLRDVYNSPPNGPFQASKRQFQKKTCALNSLGIYPQLAAMIEHGLVRKCEPEPNAVLLTRADKWLKKPGTDVRRNPRTRIAYLDDDRAGLRFGGDAKRSSIRHGGESIIDQIHKDPFDPRAFQRQFDILRNIDFHDHRLRFRLAGVYLERRRDNILHSAHFRRMTLSASDIDQLLEKFLYAA